MPDNVAWWGNTFLCIESFFPLCFLWKAKYNRLENIFPQNMIIWPSLLKYLILKWSIRLYLFSAYVRTGLRLDDTNLFYVFWSPGCHFFLLVTSSHSISNILNLALSHIKNFFILKIWKNFTYLPFYFIIIFQDFFQQLLCILEDTWWVRES